MVGLKGEYRTSAQLKEHYEIVRAYAGAMGIYVRFPLFLLRLLEGLLDRLPRRLSRAMARLSLLFNIRLVGVKK